MGEDLEVYSRRVGPIDVTEVRTIFEQLCHAVGAAHQAGIVHRDLKPENIFLSELRKVGAPYEVKVLDFGIAKVAAEAFTGNTATIGSPSWMAPEQTELGHPIEPGTDVWALGLIAFRLLTGRPFWRSLNARGASADTLLRETVLDAIPPASTRAAEYGLAECLPTGFDAWFARCVVRAHEARFTDARAAWMELAPVLGSAESPNLEKTTHFRRAAVREASVPTAPATPAALSQRASRRTIALVTLAALVGAITLVGALIFRRSQRDGSAARLLDASTVAADQIAVAVAVAAPGSAEAAAGASASPADLRDDVEVVRIPGGQFAMGAKDGEDDERPIHSVTVQPFDLDKTEVALAPYRACVAAGRCAPIVPGEGCNWGAPDRESHPINCVDWNQASAYCKTHGKRLPTEEEWEYAARGDQSRKFPWGSAAPSGQPCWNGEGSSTGKGKRESTCPAGSLAADRSPFGVLDMAGNVSEWTASHYCPYPIANCASPVRVVRGSTWADFAANTFRATYRGRSLPSERSGAIGFRCARTP